MGPTIIVLVTGAFIVRRTKMDVPASRRPAGMQHPSFGSGTLSFTIAVAISGLRGRTPIAATASIAISSGVSVGISSTIALTAGLPVRIASSFATTIAVSVVTLSAAISASIFRTISAPTAKRHDLVFLQNGFDLIDMLEVPTLDEIVNATGILETADETTKMVLQTRLGTKLELRFLSGFVQDPQILSRGSAGLLLESVVALLRINVRTTELILESILQFVPILADIIVELVIPGESGVSEPPTQVTTHLAFIPSGLTGDPAVVRPPSASVFQAGARIELRDGIRSDILWSIRTVIVINVSILRNPFRLLLRGLAVCTTGGTRVRRVHAHEDSASC
jgi:hypothetical protein